MRRALLVFGALAFSLGAAENDRPFDSAFSLTGDFAYFRREQGNNHKLVIDNSKRNCSCHYVSCKTKELVHGFSFEPGFKVAVAYTSDRSTWDLSYLWLNHWEEGCSRESSSGSLIFSVKHPDMTHDFNGADRGSAEYSSEFQNCELNYFRYVTPRYGNYFSSAYLLGLRYMNLRESLHVAFTKGGSHSSYNVRATNHIPAVQVGGLIAWVPTRTITWDLIVMAGVGFDAGEQKTFLGDYNNTTILRDYEKSGFSTPLVTEGLIRLTYAPRNYFNLHAAYQFIYLNGVLLAPDQLVKNSSNHHVYRAIGAPLIHGLTAGLSWSF